VVTVSNLHSAQKIFIGMKFFKH